MWPLDRKGPSGFSSSSTAEEVTGGADGSALTAIVTGASSGIGAETVRVLALRGVHVVMAVRNLSAGNTVKEAIIRETPEAKVDVLEIDLSSMASVRKFASQFGSMNLPLHILINNAGVMACPFSLSQDGIELQFATNYLGHFLLTHLLLENMKNTSRESNIEGRIVNVSSGGHRYTYGEGICFDKINDKSRYRSFLAYGQAKLANILHANELSRYLEKEGVNVTANSLHPGIIQTNLMRHQRFITVVINTIARCARKSIQQGAATTCFVALNPQVKGVSGKYFNNCNVAKPGPKASDVALAKKLWEFSMNMIAA